MTRYPIIGYIGKRGSGKTLSMVADASDYEEAGLKVFSNFKLDKNVFPSYEGISFSDIVNFPEYLHDCVVLLDEAHIGTDAYDFFSSRVRDITKFATQIRKKRIIFMFTTQVFTQVAKRLRLQTDYVIYCQELDKAGLIYSECYDAFTEEFQNARTRDLSAFFGAYDTNEIITL